MKRKSPKKKRVYLQNYRYLASNCPRVAIIIPNLSLCITLLLCGKILELSNLYEININENFIITTKNVYKLIAVYLQNYSYLSCYRSYTFLILVLKQNLDYAVLYGTRFATLAALERLKNECIML